MIGILFLLNISCILSIIVRAAFWNLCSFSWKKLSTVKYMYSSISYISWRHGIAITYSKILYICRYINDCIVFYWWMYHNFFSLIDILVAVSLEVLHTCLWISIIITLDKIFKMELLKVNIVYFHTCSQSHSPKILYRFKFHLEMQGDVCLSHPG